MKLRATHERAAVDRVARLIQMVLLAGAVGGWLWATRPGGVSPLFLPPPSAISRALVDIFQEGSIWHHARVTLVEFGAGFAISAVAGVAIGFWISGSDYRYALFEPAIAYLYMTPSILLYPILLLIFGLGPSSKVAFGAVLGVLPVTLNTVRGFRDVAPAYLRTARSMGVTGWRLTARVRVPAAFPNITAGLRIGAALNLIAVIVGEMLAAQAGLGHEITRYAHMFSTAKLYGYIIIVAALATVINMLFGRIELSHEHYRRESI